MGSHEAPITPSVDHQREPSRASSAEISSSGSPNVFAQPAWRRVSSQRSRRAGQPDAAALGPAGVELAAAELPVELDRVHHHPRQRHRGAQLADEAGGVERRAAGELRALEQHDVAPAQLGQVVGDRAARRRRRR